MNIFEILNKHLHDKARSEIVSPGGFPFQKQISETEFAYVMPLTYGRGRICTATESDPFLIKDSY